MLIGLCVALVLVLGVTLCMFRLERTAHQDALIRQAAFMEAAFEAERQELAAIRATERQALDDAERVAREAEAGHLEQLDARADEVAGVMAAVWKDVGLNPDQFAPDTDITRTGRLHEILHYTAERMNRPPCLRTVRDAVLALARAAD